MAQLYTAGDHPLPATGTFGQKLVNSLLSLPSRLSSRIRRVDELLEHDARRHFGVSFGQGDWDGSTFISRPPPPTFAPLPGPWGFLTSGYAVGLFIMAILLNRIQNIVVPPRHLFTYRLTRTSRNRLSFLRTIYYYILPLDFSSTPARLIFRVPSLYFLCKALLVWTVILLQAFGLFPSWQCGLQTVGDWVAHKEMEDVCWSTFCAVCGALCVGALTRGLEGSTSITSNTAPFNMFGYAFLLHIYASPITHIYKLQGLPSRPDKHVVVTIILPLLQLTMTHILGVKKRWSNHRLVPTAIACLLGLIHFHTVLWFSPSSYPLLNYMPCLFESLLALVTILTISLNALTQLLLEGAITRPLFGHAATLLPKWDEDFSIVLLRLGTASLEATSVAGLGNEVGGVAVSESLDPMKSIIEFGAVEVNRSGVTSISNTLEGRKGRRKVKYGLANEIRHVKAGSGEGELWVDSGWYREVAKFGVGLAKFGRGLWRLISSRRRIQHRQHTSAIPQNVDGFEDAAAPETDSDQSEPDFYERFLRGETVSDDDEEYDPRFVSNTASTSHTPSSMSDTAEGDGDDNVIGETVSLYADLSSSESTSTSAPLILAHMTNPSDSPLTRRRYKTLVAGGPSSSMEGEMAGNDWPNMRSAGRRLESASTGTRVGDVNITGGGTFENHSLAENRRDCVICTVEPREIICWPCRCLALCDDCRENLASRSSAAKHKCPCCRRNVEGYSRIFIP